PSSWAWRVGSFSSTRRRISFPRHNLHSLDGPASFHRMNPAALIADLTAGRTAAVARSVSVVENERAGVDALLSALHPKLGGAHRIGITGPPGAGKSTVTERLVQAFRAAGDRVAVVAVDPSSPFSGGALLGDRIRMESVALDPG